MSSSMLNTEATVTRITASSASITSKKRSAASLTETKKFAEEEHNKKQKKNTNTNNPTHNNFDNHSPVQKTTQTNTADMNMDSEEEKEEKEEDEQDEGEEEEAEKEKEEEACKSFVVNPLTIHIARRYSHETRTCVRAFLIDHDDISTTTTTTSNGPGLSLPNVLADLILDYSYHPILAQWEEIEIESMYGKKREIPLLSSYSLIDTISSSQSSVSTSSALTSPAGSSSSSSSSSSSRLPPSSSSPSLHADQPSSYVLPHRIEEVEVKYRKRLNDPHFQLPLELKILWSICDGFDEGQNVLEGRLWPSIITIESIVGSASSALQSTFVLLDTASNQGSGYTCKYHLSSGVFYAQNFYHDHSSILARDNDTHEYLVLSENNLSHAIMFESYSHLFSCLLSQLSDQLSPENLFSLASESSSIKSERIRDDVNQSSVLWSLYPTLNPRWASEEALREEHEPGIAPPYNPLSPDQLTEIRSSISDVVRDSLQLRIDAAEEKKKARNGNDVDEDEDDDDDDDDDDMGDDNEEPRDKEDEEYEEEEEEKEEVDPIQRKAEAETMKQRAKSIEAVYSDETKSAVRSYLINSRDIEMPNVLADLILEYSHHPILALWESIEIQCQQVHDPRRHADEDGARPPLLPIYTAGNPAADELSVSPHIVDEIEGQYRLKLNDPSFTLPADLKILWSMRDGFSSPHFEAVSGECDAQDQHILDTYPFPSVAQIRGPLSSSVSSLHAQYHFMESFRDVTLYMKKYHFQSGVIYATRWRKDDLKSLRPVSKSTNTASSSSPSSNLSLESRVAHLLRTAPPTIIYHSLTHQLRCLQDALNIYSDDHDDAENNPPACLGRDLIFRARDNLIQLQKEEKMEKKSPNLVRESQLSKVTPIYLSSISTQELESVGGGIQGHITPSDLLRIKSEIVSLIESPSLMELLPLPDPDSEYFTDISENHGTRESHTY